MKKNRRILIAKAVALLSVIPGMVYALSGGPEPGHSGAPGDLTCAACHGTGVNTAGGSLALNATTYTPGTRQRLVLTITDATARRWGFQATARAVNGGAAAGIFDPADGFTRRADSQGTYIDHTAAGTRPGTAGPTTFEFDWTPPASDVGDVTLYVAANAANGNFVNDAGDHVYTQSFTLKASSGTPGGQPGGPTIDTTQPGGGVMNAATLQAGIQSGSWLAIKGTNLAPTTRTWRADEIVDGKLPTQLDGVTVTVNNKPAAISYISPTQINALAPTDTALGPVEVKVTTAGGTTTSTGQFQTVAPGFFMFTDRYPAAVILDGTPTGILLGPVNLIAGANFRPARPGETVLLFGTGFGPTDPPVPADQAFAGAARTVNQVTITVGGVPATVDFAGMSSSGLYQFNVHIPEAAPDGDVPVVAEVAGSRTQDNVFVRVERGAAGAAGASPGPAAAGSTGDGGGTGNAATGGGTSGGTAAGTTGGSTGSGGSAAGSGGSGGAGGGGYYGGDY